MVPPSPESASRKGNVSANTGTTNRLWEQLASELVLTTLDPFGVRFQKDGDLGSWPEDATWTNHRRLRAVLPQRVSGTGGAARGLTGPVTGAAMGVDLNRHLPLYLLNFVLSITGLTSQDLPYYKNKIRMDGLAEPFRSTRFLA